MRLSSLAADVGAALVLSACDSDKSTAAPPNPTAVLVPTNLSLTTDRDTMVSAAVTDAQGETVPAYSAAFTSGDTTGVSIGPGGVLQAVAACTTTVTAHPVASVTEPSIVLSRPRPPSP